MSRGGIQKQTIGTRTAAIGGNEFETALITVPAKTTIPLGAVLKRNADGTLAAAKDDDDFAAVNPHDIINDSDKEQNMSMRAIISGNVDAGLLTIDGHEPSPAQRDKLRARAGIAPLKTHDISRTI